MFHRNVLRRAHVWIVLLTGIGACGDATAPRPTPGLRVVRGGNQTDTVLARANPLVIELRDAALAPVRNASVVFTAEPPPAAAPDDWRRSVYVCASTASLCANVSFVDHQVSISDTVETNDQGQATTQVQFGVLAGAGAVRVQVSAIGVDTMVSYTTKPGALAEITGSGLDTTIYLGASFSVGAHTADRWGNARSEPVTVEDLTPSVASLTNGRITGIAEGVGQISLKAANLSETVKVTVVPKGLLVAVDGLPDSPTNGRLVLLGTDGYRHRAIGTYNGSEEYPSWIAGDRILFEGGSSTSASPVLKVIDTLGNESVLLSSEFGYAIQPAYAAAARKIIFHGTSGSTLVEGLYSANVDGSSPAYLFAGVQPAPSPDASDIAYVTGGTLSVHHMSGGPSTFLWSSATLPRWSPTGDLIAFTTGAGTVDVIKPDGSSHQVIDSAIHSGSVSWSPDGHWIVASRYAVGLVLIRVSDGLIIPIHDTLFLAEPAW